MPKLHLKRTPEEQIAHELKRERKRRRRAERTTSRSKYTHEGPGTEERLWASSDEREDSIPGKNEQSDKPSRDYDDEDGCDYATLRARLDEERFREKLENAGGLFEDDPTAFGAGGRLDELEAQLNTYAHIPSRWADRAEGKKRGASDDPSLMDDEEYAEWVRSGMYRRTHAKEYEAAKQEKEARARRRAEEKARREEGRKQEREDKARRERERGSRDERKRKKYEDAWSRLLATAEEIGFVDIPWPVFAAYPSDGRSPTITLDDLTPDAITTFLMLGSEPPAPDAKTRRDKLRETLLRFHPDKFEGRVMRRVRTGERETVQDGVGRVVRLLNSLSV
ncbi:hypothetical protein BD779DRAFT_1468712 [Infundibulicybe gibba]|nr:hypothetical protein BD779DRAFT_1468712 [Infundibulicybe gibba]